MPAREGMSPNSPDRGSRIIHKKRESGPNKGTARYMRIYRGPDGEMHSAPTSSPASRHRKGSRSRGKSSLANFLSRR